MPAAGWVMVGVAAGWFVALALLLFWVAATHWITAGVLAAVMLAAAWGFIESAAFGSAPWRWHVLDPHQWPADARFDSKLLLTWADPVKPWQLILVLVLLFTWCKIRRTIRKRSAARRVAGPAAGPVQVVPVMPWQPGDWPSRAGERRRR